MIYPKLVLIPLIVGSIAFGMKIIIKAVKGDFRFDLSATYGGMPSVHTAIIISLTTVTAIYEGFFSIAFALTAIFSIIIIRDAVGFRRILGKHSVILNELTGQKPFKAKGVDSNYVHEKIGHTPIEAIVGGLIGIILTIMLYIVIP